MRLSLVTFSALAALALAVSPAAARSPALTWGGVHHFGPHFNNAPHWQHQTAPSVRMFYDNYIVPPYTVPQVTEYQPPKPLCMQAIDNQGRLVYANGAPVTVCY